MEKSKEIYEDIKTILKSHIDKTILYPYIAKDLISLGYQKVDEDKVVVSKEEYDGLWIDGWNKGYLTKQTDICKEIVRRVVEEIKEQLSFYRLENEEFNDKTQTWTINSSDFVLEVLDEKGLIDRVADKHLKRRTK